MFEYCGCEVVKDGNFWRCTRGGILFLVTSGTKDEVRKSIDSYMEEMTK